MHVNKSHIQLKNASQTFSRNKRVPSLCERAWKCVTSLSLTTARGKEASRTSAVTRTDLHSVGTPAGRLGLEEVKRSSETAVKVGTERQADTESGRLMAPSSPSPSLLKRPRAPDRWEEGRKPWLWTRDRAPNGRLGV